MIELFTKHPNSVGETYWGHFKFAVIASLRLAVSSVVFFVHAVFPFVQVPKPFDLVSTCAWLSETQERRRNEIDT